MPVFLLQTIPQKIEVFLRTKHHYIIRAMINTYNIYE